MANDVEQEMVAELGSWAGRKSMEVSAVLVLRAMSLSMLGAVVVLRTKILGANRKEIACNLREAADLLDGDSH